MDARAGAAAGPVIGQAGPPAGAAAPQPGAVPLWRAHSSLLILWLVYAMASLDRQIMSILMEPIKREFGMSDTAMGLLSGLAFALLYATLALPVARMADVGHRARITAVCCAIWSAATAACGMVAQAWQLFVARMGVAVGEAGSMAPSVALISDLYPPERRTFALSVLLQGGTVGALLGMAVGAWIAQHHGWRMVMLVFGAIGVALGAITWLCVHEPRHKGRFGGLAARRDVPPPLLREIAHLLHLRPYLMTLLGVATVSLALQGLTLWIPSFLVRSHGMPISVAGLALGVTGMVAVVGGVFAGWLADRLVRRDIRWQLGMPALGMLLSCPGVVAFLLWPAGGWTIASMVFPHALLGSMWFGFFSTWFVGSSYTAVSRMVKPTGRGVAVALMNLAASLVGAGLGPLVAGALSDLLTPLAGEQSLRWALLATMALLPLGALCFLLGIESYRVRVAELERDGTR